MENYVVNIRRELHRNAEIGFDLPKTLAIVRRELDLIGVEYTEKYGKSGIVATVNPEKTHHTIAIRADMDALPIKEENDLPYKSETEGVMHACGHDAHTAIALATLKKIYEMRDKISSRVKFIFQPAEEFAPSGAMLMARDGVMDDIDCIVALHCDTDYPAGTIGIVPEYMNATSDGFTLEFTGKSAHVAFQQYGRDAIMMAMRAYSDIEFAIAKEISARESVIFNVGAIHGGTANNIICDKCTMFCTLRTHYDTTANYLIDKIKRIGEAVASTAGGGFRFIQDKHYPALYNDPELCERMRSAAIETVGEENIFTKQRSMGGEDFSYFANIKPGCMFRLGVKNEELGITSGLHTPRFNIDERALDIGVQTFTTFVLNNMK